MRGHLSGFGQLNQGRTIVAIATPPGVGGVAILRLSGSDSESIARALTRRPQAELQSHRLYATRFYHPTEAGIIDSGLVVLMRSPRSYTGEDVAEFHVHGGLAVPQMLVQAAIACGAHLAEPGEFTLRAFLNGKLDLTQAEAVAQLIHSKRSLSARLAAQNLQGRLSGQVSAVRETLLGWLSRLEAEIDFGDEVPSYPPEQSLAICQSASAVVSELLRSGHQGAQATEGIKCVLLGAPNAGKSTLLNLLLGQDRALVSPIPGTTRDTIEAIELVGGCLLQLVDTAGVRSQTTDVIEQLGMERSLQQASTAELAILVVDGSQLELPPDSLLQSCRERTTLVLVNKLDLGLRLDQSKLQAAMPQATLVKLSLHQPEGQSLATRSVASSARQLAGDRTEVFSLTSRQLEALTRCQESLHLTGQSLLDGASAEFVCLDLKQAVRALAEIQGLDVTEEILDRIFSSFCLGK